MSTAATLCKICETKTPENAELCSECSSVMRNVINPDSDFDSVINNSRLIDVFVYMSRTQKMYCAETLILIYKRMILSLRYRLNRATHLDADFASQLAQKINVDTEATIADIDFNITYVKQVGSKNPTWTGRVYDYDIANRIQCINSYTLINKMYSDTYNTMYADIYCAMCKQSVYKMSSVRASIRSEIAISNAREYGETMSKRSAESAEGEPGAKKQRT